MWIVGVTAPGGRCKRPKLPLLNGRRIGVSPLGYIYSAWIGLECAIAWKTLGQLGGLRVACRAYIEPRISMTCLHCVMVWTISWQSI